MPKQFSKIEYFSEVEPPKDLKNAILKQISILEAKKLARKKLLFKAGFAVCVLAFLAGAFIFGQQLVASDFWSISMLSFTDMHTLAAHWQEYCYSLAETFPAFALAVALLPVLMFMALLRKYAEQFSQQFNLKIS